MGINSEINSGKKYQRRRERPSSAGCKKNIKWNFMDLSHRSSMAGFTKAICSISNVSSLLPGMGKNWNLGKSIKEVG
jgi:hypothetical protein